MKIVSQLSQYMRSATQRLLRLFSRGGQQPLSDFVNTPLLESFGRKEIATRAYSSRNPDDAGSFLHYERALNVLGLQQLDRTRSGYGSVFRKTILPVIYLIDKKIKEFRQSAQDYITSRGVQLIASVQAAAKKMTTSAGLSHAGKSAQVKARSLTQSVGKSFATPLTELPFLARKHVLADQSQDVLEKDSRFRSVFIVSVFAVLIYIILIVKVENIQSFTGEGWFFLIYSFAVTFYVLSRLLIAYFYKPQIPADAIQSDADLPTVTFGIPCKDEEENICETIERIAGSDYPKEKFDIMVINDGSDDNTLVEMKRGRTIAKKKYGVTVHVIDWKINRGKRDGMAESVQKSDKEIIVFIDSDSFVETDTLRNLVKYFVDPEVGAVAGQAYVANAEKNFLTKMQEVKYFVAFKAYKSAEAIFGGVSCCSGCCAAYRRSYIIDHMDAFLNQYFLGVRCTYGDDRSLTNIVLKSGHKALFAPDAISHTFAPDNMRQFLKQQLRWKKSWTRETFVSSKFMWKKHPFLAISHFVGFLLPLAAPFVVFRALIMYPMSNQTPPYYYFFGIVIMSFVYGLYYYIYMRDNKWIYGVIFSIFYTFLLVWQLPWAILNIRDSKWGTR